MNEPPTGMTPPRESLPFEEEDRDARVLIQLLRSHYRSGTAWDKLPPNPAQSLHQEQGSQRSRWQALSLRPPSWWTSWRVWLWCRSQPSRVRYAGVLLLAVIISTSVVLAASNILNLGKPTNATSTNPYFPLSGFHRGPSVLRQHAKVELLWIGTQLEMTNLLLDTTSAEERWPVVKALEQFGSFSKLAPLQQLCYPDPSIGHTICHIPTFDWTHAQYRSPYVQFVHKEILHVNAHPYQRLSASELVLYNRYVRDPSQPKVTTPSNRDVLRALFNGLQGKTYTLPLIDVGGYVQTVSQVLQESDFEEVLSGPTPTSQNAPFVQRPSGLTFDTIQHALADGSDPPTTHLVEDVNADANIITALICHADGGKPGKVCHRSVIKQILKHVK